PGIAPGVNIIPIKVLNASGGTTVTPFLAGIEWCVNNATRFNISVISISIGGSTYISVCDGESIPSLFVPVINEAVSKNITVMVSAGNDYSALGLTDPACIANATSVGRTNDDDTISSNSKTASFLDFLAPGTGIISTKRTGGFTSKDGTSMSTPHVAATVALLQQYYHKYYGRFTDTETIKAALNASGPKINDTRLGLDQEFTRVDVYGAYEALITDAPVLAFIDPTPANGSGLLTLDYTFNVSINDTSHNISYCYLTFNSTRYVMGVNDTTVQNATCNVSVNLGMPEKGNYSYYVTGLDDKGELGISETWQVEVLNTPPTINNVSEYGNLSSKETELLTLTVNVSDFNGDTLTFNWLLNETSIATTQNLSHTFNHSQAATYWNLTLNVSDGENYTTQVWNVSVNNTNRLPVFNNPTSYVVNESQMINITLNVTDNDDDDTLTYGTNASLFTQNVNDFNWTTNYTDAGTYSILFNVTDGTVVVNQTVTLTVNDKARLNANSSNITSSVELNIFVNGSLNDTELTEVIALNLTDTSNNTLITFDWNFSSANMSVDIDYVAGSGTLIVRGLDLSSQSVTKTVYVNKSTSTFDYVCVVDKEVDSIATLSSDCSNANETNVPCPGTNGAYSCAVEGSYFKVSGLNHSAIKGMTTPAVGDPGGSGTGGSGGGDDSDDDVLVVCQEDWICEGFKECIDEKLTRRCFDGNNCGTTLRQPLLEKECVEETYQTQEPEVEPTPEVVPEVVPEVKKSGFQQVINNIGNWFKNLNKEKTDTEEVDSNKFNLEGKGQRILLFLIGIFAFLLVMLIVWKR
ncbi:S8 family serine peptidase, partial [Candidatus Woesearchaeota archaeon]|nr:S8 family serine peptidase [Candidatus Woesearchaeota archaeon]